MRDRSMSFIGLMNNVVEGYHRLLQLVDSVLIDRVLQFVLLDVLNQKFYFEQLLFDDEVREGQISLQLADHCHWIAWGTGCL